MKYQCPVCGYAKLEDPPSNQEICPSCGTQFGYHDIGRSHSYLRLQWIARQMPWRSVALPQPNGWNPIAQLRLANFLGVPEINGMLNSGYVTISKTSRTKTTRRHTRLNAKNFSVMRPQTSPTSNVWSNLSVSDPGKCWVVV